MRSLRTDLCVRKTIAEKALVEQKKRDAPSVLFVDPFSRDDHTHLDDDDLFLSECIAPLTRKFLAATSFASGKNLQRQLNIETIETPCLSSKTHFNRLRLFRLVLSLPSANFDHIIFQSFEEVSTLLLLLLHPRKRVHIIVTNNFRPDRLKRHPVVGRFFLRAVLSMASSIIVHSSHEVDVITTLVSRIDAEKIFIKPFHQIGLSRAKFSIGQKSNTILYLGPECAHKKIKPVIDLLNADKDCKYRYVLCSMRDDMSKDIRSFLEAKANVELSFGYTPMEKYYRLFSEAALIILTHDADYEGTLSGAFCDAIASGTPVIARNMAPHNEYFNRFGPMGILVDYEDPDWLKAVIEMKLENICSDYQNNMAMCRAACGMEANRDIFRFILDRG